MLSIRHACRDALLGETPWEGTLKRTTTRRRRERGSSTIELILTLLPTLALIFGLIDFGLMLFRWSTLQNAVREGARYAITFQTQTGMGQDASIKQVVQNYAFGVVKTTDSPPTIHVNYYNPANPDTPISNGGNVPGNIVEVSVQNVSWSWMVPISGSYGGDTPMTRSSSPLAINVYSSDVLGGFPAGVNAVTR